MVSDETKQPPDVQSILKAWLKEHGYDGLCEPSIECGCGVDELPGCCSGWVPQHCQPAHRCEVKPGEWRYVTDDWEQGEVEEWE